MTSYKAFMNSMVANESIRVLTERELKQLKETMLNCYKDVAKVCQENNINIMLGGGSVLGAVRHKGYIPWDDDFDVLMPRSDFEHFKAIFNEKLGDKYILNAPNFEGIPTNRFPKILIKGTKYVELGEELKDDTNKIKIDIFILENIPQNKFVRAIKGLYCTALMYIAGQVGTYEARNSSLFRFMSQTSKGKSILLRRIIIGKLFSFLPYSMWCNMIDRACQYRHDTDLLGIPSGRKHYFGEVNKKNTYLPATQGTFEGLKVNLPKQYDCYLTKLYGNYMEIPPLEKREKHYILDIQF